MESHSGNRDSQIPTWSGDPLEWTKFRDEVRLWSLGENMGVSYSLGARLAGRMKGSARRSVINMTEKELLPESPKIDNAEDWQTRNRLGIKNVMAKLEALVGTDKPTRRGECMDKVFSSNQLYRRKGERITDWLTRFDEAEDQLKENGIDLEAITEIKGYFLFTRAGLNEERRERLLASLPDDSYPAMVIRAKLVRQFGRIHINEKSSTPTTTTDAKGKSKGSKAAGRKAYEHRKPFQKRQVLTVQEEDDDDDYGDDDGGGEDEGGASEQEFDPSTLQGNMRSEIEALASELESRNADMGDYFNESQVAKVDEAVMSLMNAPEALATVQTAREKMQRGKNGRFQPGGGKAVAPKRGAAKRKPMNKTISDRKADTTCFDCGESGHWAGDKGCSKPGAGSFKPHSREICLADHLDDCEDDDAEPAYIPAESLVIEKVSTGEECIFPRSVLASRVQEKTKSDLRTGVVDTACRFSLMGEDWWHDYEKVLKELNLHHLVEIEQETEVYKFGDDGMKTSKQRITFPAVIGGQACRIPSSVIPGISLPLLIGRDFLSEAEATLYMGGNGKLSINGKSQDLQLSRAEHFACPLQPEKYHKLTEGRKPMQMKTDVPRRLRSRNGLLATVLIAVGVLSQPTIIAAQQPQIEVLQTEQIRFSERFATLGVAAQTAAPYPYSLLPEIRFS